jgi:uncharacterized protein YjlB
MAETDPSIGIETLVFADDGDVPNNPALALIVYRGALPDVPDRAAAFEEMFSGNAWPSAWRDGVYARHHYHSTAHEVLGIAAGAVRVRLGGERGETVEIRAGDVVVIPAGVAHKREWASGDLLVVGAYPRGQHPDLCRPGQAERERSLRTIASVPLPNADPVFGADGPLVKYWRNAGPT